MGYQASKEELRRLRQEANEVRTRQKTTLKSLVLMMHSTKSVSEMAKLCNRSERTIYRYLKELVDSSHIPFNRLPATNQYTRQSTDAKTYPW